MKAQFVTYELSLQLKTLGFDEECFGYYYKHGNSKNEQFFVINEQDYPENNKLHISAPLWQQAFEFILQKYNKHCIPFSDGFQWTFDIRWVDNDDIMQYPSTQFPSTESERIMSDTFEENRKKALSKLIEIVSKK